VSRQLSVGLLAASEEEAEILSREQQETQQKTYVWRYRGDSLKLDKGM